MWTWIRKIFKIKLVPPVVTERVITTDQLQPGDCLLYEPSGAFGHIIAIKTGHHISHVEVYIGGAESVASRDGIGVGRYPLRTSQLVKVCRPNQAFDLQAAMAWFRQMPPTKYGWLDLAVFSGLPIDGPGMVCSPFAAEFYRAGGLNPFNGEPSINIAPFQFDVSNCFDDYAVATPKEVAIA